MRSAVTQEWIELAVALVAAASCVLEARNCKGRYHRARRPNFLDEAPLEPAVSALTPSSAPWESVDDEWSIDSHDELGNPIHACSRGAQCSHVVVTSTS